MTPRAGTIGKYTLLAKLATGGMGEIFLARLEGEGGFEKLVVLKRLLPELVADELFVAMFLNEARIAAQLSHTNICDVYELGHEAGQYFIAMQYLNGVPFPDVVESKTSANQTQHLRLVAGLMQQACEGIHHAHELEDIDGNPLGLVHRDVSPSNLFVAADGVLKVLDFGIAKAQGTPKQTSKGSIKGKVPYMSPEQIRGEELDRRSDVYSLGVVLYEALTRRRLFRRDSPFLVAKAILEDEIPLAHHVVPQIPTSMSAVIRQAMSRDKRERQRTARALGTAIGDACGEIGGVLATAEIGERIQAAFASALDEQREQYRRAVRGDRALEPESGSHGMFDRHTVSYAPTPEERSIADPTGPTTPGKPAARAELPTEPAVRRSRRGIALVGGLAIVLAAAIAAGYTFCRSDASTSPDASPSVAITAAMVDAAAPDPEVAPRLDAAPLPAPDAAPSPEPTRVDARPASGNESGSPSGGRRPSKKPGYFSIDSTPYATIYIDGRKLGITPLIRKPVPPGRHQVRAVLEDGRERTFPITVKPGKHAPPKQLYW